MYEDYFCCFAFLMMNTVQTYRQRLVKMDEYWKLKEKDEQLFDYIWLGCKLVEEGNDPEYIAMAMEYELLCISKNRNDMQIRIAVLFKTLLSKAIQNRNKEFFQMIYIGEYNWYAFHPSKARMIQKMLQNYFPWEWVFITEYLPEGYVFSKQLLRGFQFVNENQEVISFTQLSHHIPCEDLERIERMPFSDIQWGEQILKISENGFQKAIYFTFAYQQYSYTIFIEASHLPVEELFKIIKNIKPT